MVALPGPLGGLHFAQQRVHFGQRQAAVGAHRAVTGERRQQFVAALGQQARHAEFGDFGKHRAGQFDRVGVLQ